MENKESDLDTGFDRTGPAGAESIGRRVREFTANYSLLMILVVFIIGFAFLRPDTFATVANLRTILTSNSVVAILAIGALFPLVVGEFDLSIGANLGLSLVLSTGLSSQAGINPMVAILMAVSASTLVGLVNGLLVARAGIDAFVTTLGMSALITGVVFWYSNGGTFSTGLPELITGLGTASVLGVPAAILVLTLVLVLGYYVMNATPLGRYLYAVGGSKDASRLSGLNVPLLTTMAFVVSGFLAGIAGILQAGLLGSGNPSVGPGYLLPAFAAVFLGATSFRRGTFNVTGTVVATFTLAVGVNGLVAIGVPFYIEPIFTGLALLTAALGARAFARSRSGG